MTAEAAAMRHKPDNKTNKALTSRPMIGRRVSVAEGEEAEGREMSRSSRPRFKKPGDVSARIEFQKTFWRVGCDIKLG
jgi:hypothetical protein